MTHPSFALRLGFLIGSLTLWLPLGLAQQSPERLIEAGDQLADRMEYQEAVENYTEAYMTLVSLIRGQDFQRSVKPTLMTRQELATEMREQFDVDYQPQELQMTEASYRGLGLIPPSLDVKQTMIQLLTEEVGGFYDPSNERMVLIRGESLAQQPGFLGKLLGQTPTFDKEEQKSTLSHELTHALQDQLYGLKAMQDSIGDDDDMRLAFTSLVEGDATLVMFGEMGRQQGSVETITEMDPEQARMMFGILRAMMPFATGGTFRQSPPIFRESLLFPYLNGMVFTLHLSRAGGMERIHQAFSSPPVSTEQILHPAKYLHEVDTPVILDIPQLPEAVGQPWRFLGSNCLGEFQMGILLKPVDPRGNCSAGWDGDRYYTFCDEESHNAIAWISTWDTEEDAIEFQEGIERLFQQRKKALTKLASQSESQPGSEQDLESNPAIRRAGNEVFILIGFQEKQHAALLPLMDSVVRRDKVFPGRAKAKDVESTQ